MLDSLAGPRLKVRRGLDGYQQLATELAAFAETKPYDVLSYDDLDARQRIFQVRVNEEPPARLGVLVGEIVHNLRSALDHMACILPLKAGAARNAKPFFPIYTRRDPDPADKSLPSFIKGHRLQGVTSEAMAVVEGLQPYKATEDPNAHPLAVLDELWNWDKHNAIHVVSASLRPPQIEGITTPGVSFAEGGPIYDGQVLGRIPLDGFQAVNDNPEPMNDLNFAIHPAIGVSGPASGRLIGPTLGALCQYVYVNAMGPLERVIVEARRHSDAS